jgi:hypothetical protein
MRLAPVLKVLLALMVSSAIAVFGADAARTAVSAAEPSVTIDAVSGYQGHAFVYAEVHSGTGNYPAPTGTHRSPYYAEWVPEALSSANCPWVWAVYVFDRATNTQINAPPPNSPNRNFGTTTMICPSPSTTPVGMPQMESASARLDLDLSVSVNPSPSTAGSPSTVLAVLAARLSQDLNLYMNMAIEAWQVSKWFFDFGDGQSTNVNTNAVRLSVPHTYQVAGQYDARAIASIAGDAQAAIYDRYGNPTLVQQRFALQIGNDALTNTRARSVRRYLPPNGVVTVTPTLDGAQPVTGMPGFRRIDALRGRLTVLAVHLLLLGEGTVTVDGHTIGAGRSRLTAWRLDGARSDAPAGTGTVPGTIHSPGDALVLQWDSPDRVDRNQGQNYSVPITLFLQTRYSDGHIVNYAIATSFLVAVNFPAESG